MTSSLSPPFTHLDMSGPGHAGTLRQEDRQDVEALLQEEGPAEPSTTTPRAGYCQDGDRRNLNEVVMKENLLQIGEGGGGS